MSGRTLLSATLAVALLGMGSGVAAQENSSGSQTSTAPGFFLHEPGADDAVERPAATQATSRWLFVPAAAFVRRTSTQSLTVPGPGCIYSNDMLNADLQLPSGAVVVGVRTYYYNQGQAGVVRTWLTSYGGDGGYTDHIGQNSTGNTGYTSEYFGAPTPLTVDHYSRSYALNARIDSNLRLCGMRVFYEFQ